METIEERREKLKKEKDKRVKANCKADKAAKATKATKNAAPKSQKTKGTSKAPHQQLATKATHKSAGGGGNGGSGGPKIKKPHVNYAIIVMRNSLLSKECRSPDPSPSLSKVDLGNCSRFQNGSSFPECCHLGIARGSRSLVGWLL